MWEIEGLQSFGTWCQVGVRKKINNELADFGEKKGFLKKIKYLGKNCGSDKNYVRGRIKYHKDLIEYHKEKVLYNQEKLRKLK